MLSAAGHALAVLCAALLAGEFSAPAMAISSKGTSSSGGSSSGGSSSTGSAASGGPKAGTHSLNTASGTSYSATSYRVYTSSSHAKLYTGSLRYRTYPIVGIAYVSVHHPNNSYSNYGTANYTGRREA